MTRQIDRMTCRVLRQALQTARSWVWVTRTCGEFPALVGSKIIRMTARVVLLQPPRHIGAYQLCHRGASAFGDSFQHLSVVMIEPDKLVMPALFGLAVLPPPVPHGCPSGAPSMVRRGCQRGPGGNIPNGAPARLRAGAPGAASAVAWPGRLPANGPGPAASLKAGHACPPAQFTSYYRNSALVAPLYPRALPPIRR